MPYFDTT
ncbi:hypothetical protein F383_01250 [Gossypium arboreum]|nr:hypothetical protein F383_01250 [Gossypium arboreum]